MCVCVCVCVSVCLCFCLSGRKSPIKTTKMATFTRIQIRGRDLGSLVGETTGNIGCDFVLRENADSEVMNSGSLFHIHLIPDQCCG